MAEIPKLNLPNPFTVALIIAFGSGLVGAIIGGIIVWIIK